jgi:hypothetical protein
MRRSRIPDALAAALSLLLLVSPSGCRPSGPTFTATATDGWVRSYAWTGAGIVLSNRYGRIAVEATDEPTVDVRAERLVRAVTEQLAREIAPRIAIEEETTPDGIAVTARGVAGLIVGAEFEVHYHVRAPRAAPLRIRAGQGVTLDGFSGPVVVSSSRGGIVATNLTGALEARATGGDATVSLAAVKGDLVEVRTTNGSIALTLPAGAGANLTATATNGRVEVAGLRFEPAGEQSARRVRGRLNDGGPPIELAAVNGGVTVSAAPSDRPGARP